MAGLAPPLKVRYVFLAATAEIIEARLSHRTGHFMNPMLIPSQFEALEQPEDSENVITIAADLDTSTQADSVIIQLGDVSHRQLHLNATLPQKAEAASLTSVI